MSHVPQKLIPAQDLKECAVCGRSFTLDRINDHETICQKSSIIDRKRFDLSQQRIMGTEIERFAKTGTKSDCVTTLPKSSPSALSTNWRWKHEDLIQKVNEAKQSVGKKTKANDLPFPSPVDYDTDYVQCPHCLRPFNEPSASRHISSCARRMCNFDSKTNVSDAKTTPSQHILE